MKKMDLNRFETSRLTGREQTQFYRPIRFSKLLLTGEERPMVCKVTKKAQFRLRREYSSESTYVINHASTFQVVAPNSSRR